MTARGGVEQRVDDLAVELANAGRAGHMETARVPAKLLHGSADDAPPSNLGVACDDVTHLSAGGGDLVALVVDSGLRVVVVQLSPSPTILQRVLYSSKVRLVALQKADVGWPLAEYEALAQEEEEDGMEQDDGGTLV